MSSSATELHRRTVAAAVAELRTAVRVLDDADLWLAEAERWLASGDDEHRLTAPPRHVAGSTTTIPVPPAADESAGPMRYAAAWRERASLGAEVWVYDKGLQRVLLVEHEWRGWVPPGGQVELGEHPREAAQRELFEETGVSVTLHGPPAVATVRSFAREWLPTLSLSYAAVVAEPVALHPEPGQPAAWHALDQGWQSVFPDDCERICWHAQRLRQEGGFSV